LSLELQNVVDVIVGIHVGDEQVFHGIAKTRI